MEKRYEILPHTADSKFRAFGLTLEEAYGNAAVALASLMWDWAKIPSRKTIELQVRARDREQLLVKFLNEIIFLADTRGFLLGSVEELLIDETDTGLALKARLRGDDRSGGYELSGEVKAATYNEIYIKEDGGFKVEAVVDS